MLTNCSGVSQSSPGAEGAIARIAKSGQDIGAAVEQIVDGGCPDGYVGMDTLDPLETFRRAKQTNESDVPGATLFEPIDGGDCRVGRGDHRRHHDNETLAQVRRRFEE